MSINIICAVNNKGYIGKDGKLLYRIKKDLNHFRKLTENKTVIMGHKTYLEIGKALPNRRNIVLTNKNVNYSDIDIHNSFEDALNDALSNQGEVFIIGGESLYKEALFLTDDIYLTEVDDDTEGDVIFPIETIKFFFDKVSSIREQENGLKFEFNHYKLKGV